MSFVLAGEITSQRAGVLNIGVEGQMLVGAAAGFAVALLTRNAWLGVLGGALAGVGLSAVFAFLCLICRANQITAGVAILLLGSGFSAYFGIPYVGLQISGFSPFSIPGLPGWAENIVRQVTPTMVLAVVLPFILGGFLFGTRVGLRWRAIGESTRVAWGFGFRPGRYRLAAILLSGFMSGFGGAALSVDYTKGWSEGMTAGRGLVAIGLVVIARWNPLWTTPVAMIFGLSESLSLTMQSTGLGISSYLLATLPYLVPILLLALDAKFSGALSRMPASLNDIFVSDSDRL
jgi:simple sugar transport system permease protein